MYQYYDITLRGSNTLTLTYKLEQHRPAQVWASLVASAKIESLRSNLNPWQNFNKNLLTERISKLENLIDQLNTWLPDHNKITGKWNHQNHQESVNRLHVHFPEQEKTETDDTRRSQLTLYNDLIHEIEDLTIRPNESRPHLLICPDTNTRINLEEADYKYFKACHSFGSLCLHYCHVGRHPYELYSANDFNCPVNQIIPQNSISTYHTLRFYDTPYMEHWHKGRFFQFYQVSTLKQLIDFNDPKMAFGYIGLGKLVTDVEKDDILKSVCDCSEIIDWKLY